MPDQNSQNKFQGAKTKRLRLQFTIIIIHNIYIRENQHFAID